MKTKIHRGESKKVIVSILLRFASSRDVLSGVFHYLETTASDWTLHLMQPEDNPLTPERLHAAEEEGIAGIFITNPGSSELMCALAKTPLPVIAVGFKSPSLKSRKGHTAIILNDNSGIGTMGANYFLNLGKFNSFGFVPGNIDSDYMTERTQAFCARIADAAPGAPVNSFPSTKSPGSEEDIAALADWIAALPKPAAVMAGADWRAVHILAACERTKVRVPDAVAILGVDNDEFSCAHSSPPLSSILPGHMGMGYCAAEELDRIIRGKGKGSRKVVTIPPKTVVERESTRIREPSAVLIDKANRFIRANALLGIRVSDVVKHLRVSQSLAEIRYRAATGKTMRESIEAVRMEKLKHLLVSTHRPIAVLAAECGFRDANSLSHHFRKLFGISMREYRTQNRTKQPRHN